MGKSSMIVLVRIAKKDNLCSLRWGGLFQSRTKLVFRVNEGSPNIRSSANENEASPGEANKAPLTQGE